MKYGGFNCGNCKLQEIKMENIRIFVIYFSLSVLFFPLTAFPADWSGDRHHVFEGEPVDDRKTDLTSDYLDVHFSGVIETENLPNECLYKIPRLTC